MSARKVISYPRIIKLQFNHCYSCKNITIYEHYQIAEFYFICPTMGEINILHQTSSGPWDTKLYVQPWPVFATNQQLPHFCNRWLTRRMESFVWTQKVRVYLGHYRPHQPPRQHDSDEDCKVVVHQMEVLQKKRKVEQRWLFYQTIYNH